MDDTHVKPILPKAERVVLVAFMLMAVVLVTAIVLLGMAVSASEAGSQPWLIDQCTDCHADGNAAVPAEVRVYPSQFDPSVKVGGVHGVDNWSSPYLGPAGHTGFMNGNAWNRAWDGTRCYATRPWSTWSSCNEGFHGG